MKSYSERFKEIQKIKREKRMIDEELRVLCQPTLTDLSRMQEVYEAFLKIRPERNPENQKKFIFVAIYLYHPGSLVSGKMRKGLRNSIAKTIGRHPVQVSYDSRNLLFHYQRYKKLSTEMDEILSEIEDAIK